MALIRGCGLEQSPGGARRTRTSGLEGECPKLMRDKLYVNAMIKNGGWHKTRSSLQMLA